MANQRMKLILLPTIFLALRHVLAILNLTEITRQHRELCPYTDFCSYEAMELSDRGQVPCCRSCSCNTDCGQTGHCCLDSQDTRNAIDEYNLKIIDTKPDIPSTMDLYMLQTKFYMVDSCPIQTDVGYKSRCFYSNDTVFGSVWPVYSPDTGLIYKNYFCALCHGVQSTLFWRPLMLCKSEDVDVETIDTNTFRLKDGNSVCDVVLIPPGNKNVAQMQYFDDVIDACNVSGQWDLYDDLIESACSTLRTIYRTYDRTYANVFCKICNAPSSEIIPKSCIDGIDILWSINSPVSFQALLDFEVPSSQCNTIDPVNKLSKQECNFTQFYDPYKNTCRELQCPVTMQRRREKCVLKLKKIVKANLFLVLKVSVSDGNGMIDNDSTFDIKATYAQEFTDKLFDEFNKSPLYKILAFIVLFKCNGTSTTKKLVVIPYAIISLLQPTTNSTSVLPEDLSLWYLNFNFDKQNVTVYFKIFPNWLLLQKRLNAQMVQRCTEEWNNNSSWCYQTTGMSYLNSPELVKLTFLSKMLVKKTWFCQTVELDKKEYLHNTSEQSIYLFRKHLFLFHTEFSVVTNGYGDEVIYVCLDDYLPSVRSPSVNIGALGYRSWPALLSVVSSLFSIFCVTFTLAVYAILKELRTFPGKLNMILLTNLLVAQTSLCFGVNETKFPSLCIATGAVIHFSWLATVFWTHVACIHMYGVFYSVRFITDSCRKKMIAIYSTACYVLAGLFVLFNILSSLIQSNFHDFGYGPNLCYINSNQMVTFTFALPVGLVVLANCTLYFRVVCKFYLDKHNSGLLHVERNYLSYCVRLSSLTGMTWLSGFLYTWTRVWFLEYLFVSLWPLQGLFIMLSFVFTKRTWSLCSYWIHGTNQQNTNPDNTQDITGRSSLHRVRL